MPIKIIADLSELSQDGFWKESEKRGFAYLYNTQGERALLAESKIPGLKIVLKRTHYGEIDFTILSIKE